MAHGGNRPRNARPGHGCRADRPLVGGGFEGDGESDQEDKQHCEAQLKKDRNALGLDLEVQVGEEQPENHGGSRPEQGPGSLGRGERGRELPA